MNLIQSLFYSLLEMQFLTILGNLDSNNSSVYYDATTNTLQGTILIALDLSLFEENMAEYLYMNAIHSCYANFQLDCTTNKLELSLLLLDMEANDACIDTHAYLKELILYCIMSASKDLSAAKKVIV